MKIKPWKKRLGIAILFCLVAYIISFLFAINVFQGTKSVDGFPNSKKEIWIFISQSSDNRNQYGKIFYYPIIRSGEAAGLWLYIDDAAKSSATDGPCLFRFLAGFRSN